MTSTWFINLETGFPVWQGVYENAVSAGDRLEICPHKTDATDAVEYEVANVVHQLPTRIRMIFIKEVKK